jgi:hypothetical protein
MTATAAEGTEQPLVAAGATIPEVAYRTALAAFALAVVAAAAVAAPDSGAVFLGRFFGAAILRAHSVPLQLGAETFTAAGAYDGGIGWLGALTISLLAAAGPAALVFATMLAALATFALVELRARRAAGRRLGLAAAALAGLCALGSFGVAGGIVTAAFAAALAYVLERPGPRAAALGTLIALVWCNAAPQGLLAPVIGLCSVAGVTFGAASPSDRRWARLALAGTVLATLATPALLAYPALALEGLRIDRALAGVVSINPIEVAPLGYRIGFTLVVLVACALGIARGREGTIPLLLFGTLLALANGAYVVVFGVLVAPLLAASAAAAFPAFARGSARAPRADFASAGFAVVLAAVVAWQAGQRPAPLNGGFALATTLAADGRAHRLYCWNLDWCDAVLSSSPRVAVFMDGRVAAYPPDVRSAKADIVSVKATWRKVLNERRVDAMLVAKDHALAGLLALSPEWRAVDADDSAVLYERTAVAR